MTARQGHAIERSPMRLTAARSSVQVVADSPVVSPDHVLHIARDFLGWTQADTSRIYVEHIAIGMARIAFGHVRMEDNGDQLILSLETQFGQRAGAHLNINQIDAASIRHAAEYLDRLAREQPGDPVSLAVPVPPRTYLPNTTWNQNTANAFAEARHAAVQALVGPVLDAGIAASGLVGVHARTTAYMDKHGIEVAAQETDAELVVTGWTADGKGAGWAGQAARDWRALDPAAVAHRGIELTQRSANPVAFEPGRYMAILDRPAVAQVVYAMGSAFDAEATLGGRTPLYNPATQRPRLGTRIMDARVTMRSNPNDPDGGFIPFTWDGAPMIDMAWIDRGVHANLAFKQEFAARVGYAPSNYPPGSLRLEAAPSTTLSTVDEMIATCKMGIFVNRFAYIDRGGDDPTVGMLTGVTSGGCFLVRNGAIDKPIRNLRFVDSPWLFLNRLEAIGTAVRAPFGFAPWTGSSWPVDPTIVPPLMIRDFNFTALAEVV